MRQLTKEVYETPLTTKRVVTMESSCMAASGEEMKKDKDLTISTSSQAGGKEGIDFGDDNPWSIGRQ